MGWGREGLAAGQLGQEPGTLAQASAGTLQGSLSSGHWLVPILQAGTSACCKPKQQTKVPEEAGQPAALWFDSVNNPLSVGLPIK